MDGCAATERPLVPTAHCRCPAHSHADERTSLCPLPYIPRMTNTVPAGLGLGLGLLLVLTGCGSDGPRLTSPGLHGVTEGAARVHQGDTVTIGSMFGCLDKSGSVTITDIAPVNGTGMKVTGWAVRPNPFWKKPDPAPPVGGQIGVARMPLAKLLFPTSPVVDAQCKDPDKDGIGYEFAVQVQKTTSGEAGASGWVVTYTSDGKTKRVGYPIAVRLCNEDADAKRCMALKV